MTSRVFGKRRPRAPHFTDSTSGLSGEVASLRKDTEAAFLQIQTESAGSSAVRNALGTATLPVGHIFYDQTLASIYIWTGSSWTRTNTNSLTFATPAALSATATTNLPAGAQAWVTNQGSWYYMPADTGTPDASTCVAAVGGGNWIRGIEGFPGAHTVGSWFVDSILGDNANDGLAAGAGRAVKNCAEIVRRIAKQVIDGIVVLVSVVGDDTAAQTFTFYLANNAFIAFTGTRTVLNTYVLSAATAWNEATGVVGSYTLTGAPNITALGYLNKLARVNGGARDGVKAGIANDLGSGVFNANFGDQSIYDVTEPQVGDSLQVYSVPKLGGDVQISVFGEGILFLEALDIGTIGASHGSGVHAGTVQFIGCVLRGIDAFQGADEVTLDVCLTLDAHSYTQMDVWACTHGSVGGSGLSSRGGTTVWVGTRILLVGSQLNVGHPQNGPGDIRADGTIAILSMNSGSGTTITHRSSIVTNSYFFERNCAGTPGIVVDPGGAFYYTSGKLPAFTGATTPAVNLSIGRTSKAAGALPFIEPANNAAVVVK